MEMMKKAMAVIIAASAVLSVAGSCFADEWKETDSGMTYIDDSGKAVTGLKEIDGSKYYFNTKGIMKTGWLTAKSGKKYYFDKDGKMHTGWLRDDGSKYYFGKNGAMATGSVKISGSYYLFDEDGKILTGWQTVDGEDYYYCTNGRRAVNRTVSIDGERVRFDKNGKVRTDTKYDEYDNTKPVTSVTTAAETETAEEETAEEKKIIPEEIVVTNTEFTINNGAKFKLSYSFRPITTNCKDVTFSSSRDSVVSVNSKGEIKALKLGKATITIKSKEDKSVYVKIKITVK